MIIVQLPNTTTYSITSGMATKIKGESLTEVISPEVNEICYCKLECEYKEKVFASISNDYWKNDKNTFIFRRLISTDTVTINLYKGNVLIATIVDNTFGEFINGYPSGTPDQQLYVVFTIYWQNVFNTFGGGQYQISTDLNILGNTSTELSTVFNLQGYSDQNANGTVRIETIQNGNIIGSPFDFTGLNVYQSYRLGGKLTEITPTLEDDSYLDFDYIKNQIQTKLIPKWLLKTKRIPRVVSILLSRDTILANEILITDYNIFNEAIFRRVSLYPESIDKPDIGKTTKPIFEITFVDKIENTIKRNF
jgi:hypothetical protein